jgi:N-acyl-D-amino-acid deacylase
MEAEVVIRGGTVVDGTGAPGRRADVAVTGGRIAAIDEVNGAGDHGGDAGALRGESELDASGKIVAPGFIDIHTHYDAQVFFDPWLTPSCFHGVTTVIAGNCGFSIAPIRSELVPLMARTLQHVEDMSFDTLREGVPWDEFETFPEYLDAVQARGSALNYGCYVGHTAVRLFVMGEEAYERPADAKEISRMQEVVADSMAAGAMGFASSASPTHNGDKGRPVPSRVGDMNELRSLLEPVRDAQKGVVALLPGGVIHNSELFDIAREIARPITWTALLTVKGFPYHEKVVAENDAARDEGAEVWPQVSCRPLVFQMNLLEPFTLNVHESFSKLMGLSREERGEVYKDPKWRESSWQELSGTGGRLPFNWPSVSVAETRTHPELIGRPLVEIASERGCTALDVMLDVSLDDDLETRFWSVLANNDPDAIAWLLPRDNVLLGLADSGAHVSQLCDACFATDLLGPWVRDRKVMSLERAVHKLTGEPATVYGLTDRGTIEVGKAADVCVFDPNTVAPGPLRRVVDFPANGERLVADSPEGVSHVLVNGVPVRVNGVPAEDGLSRRPGVLLRS